MNSGALSFTENTITIVVGPTASGKSKWALQAALQCGGAICNADSLQVFRKLDIGTAKPTFEERKRCPHYLFDLVDPDQSFTAGDYRRAALKVIEDNLHNQSLFFVGGSGFYIQALERGMYPAHEASAQTHKLLDQWQAEGRLREELKRVDPNAYAKITSNDLYRTRRALEIFLTEGKTIAEIQDEFTEQNKPLSESYKVRKIGILADRRKLRERVQIRIEHMLEQGFIDEVKGLMASGYGDAKPLKSVGYKECADHIEGRLNLKEMKMAIETATMQLAKKQMTWFRRDKDIEWLDPES